MTDKIATFNKLVFSYQEKHIEEINTDEYAEIYNDIIIIESNNSKYKQGDKIEQITVLFSLHFEYNDGTEY